MRFVHLTGPTGAVVSVNPDEVAELRAATAGVDSPGAHTVIVFESGSFQNVRETLAEVEEKLK